MPRQDPDQHNGGGKHDRFTGGGERRVDCFFQIAALSSVLFADPRQEIDTIIDADADPDHRDYAGVDIKTDSEKLDRRDKQ